MQNPNELPPPAAVFQLITNLWATQAVATFARLGGPDQLASGPKTAEAIALATESHPDAMARLLRGIATTGIVRRTPDGGWELSEVGHLLRRDVPGSMRALLLAETAPGHWLPWGQMLHSVRTGEPSTKSTLGTDCWTYYERNPEEARDFAEGMSGILTRCFIAPVCGYRAALRRRRHSS